jgi:hypothetical protein
MPGGVFATLNEVGKLAKTFSDIGNALPDRGAGKKFTDFVDKIKNLVGDPGLSQDLAAFLGAVGQVATVIGNVFFVVGAAVAAVKLIGIFSEGPSPLEVLVKARFDALDKDFTILRNLTIQDSLASHLDALISARAAVEEFVSQRDSGTLTSAEIESRQQMLVNNLQTGDGIKELLLLVDLITYNYLFEADKYEKVWPWIAAHLFRLPAGQPPVRADFPAVNSPVFDYRSAVPLGTQAAQTFLGLIRDLSPEFRTTGDFRSQIRAFVEKLDPLAAALRNSCLARTIYSSADFGFLIDDFYVIDPVPGLTVPILKPEYFLMIGALDLCSHTDAFFSDVVRGGGVPFPGPSRRGSLDFRWAPPARLVRVDSNSGLVHQDGTPIIQYRISNPDECAQAANEQAAQDYSDLLISSGYMSLVQLTALMRHSSTQPDQSETVHPKLLTQRLPNTGSVVTVHSPLQFSGDIQSPAWRVPQTVRAFANSSTQPVPRTPPQIHYRVLLRTLASATPPGLWREPDYGAVQRAIYIDDPLNPGFKRLHLDTSMDSVLHEELLIEGSTPLDILNFKGTLTFKAHTFDWWIPTQPTLGGGAIALEPFANEPHVVAGGKAGVAPRPFPLFVLPLQTSVSENNSDLVSSVVGVGWEDGAQSWQGQHREMEETTIQVDVSLEWIAAGLRVVIDSRPQDRNYILFLVVEETFGSIEKDEVPPKVLHTALPIPVNGQLTFVPQAFFDQERAAIDRLAGFSQEYAISTQPKPGEPVIGTIFPGELTTEVGVERLVAAVKQFHPADLIQLTTGKDGFQEGRGHVEIKFSAKPEGAVNDLADVFLKHNVLSDERVIRRWPTSQALVVCNLDASQTGIYTLQALSDHHEAAGQFVTIREGQEIGVVLVLENKR